MRKILVVQHVAHEILGTLNPLLKKRGFRIRYINFGRTPEIVPTLDGYSGLIVLGGPMGVYEDKKYPHLKVEMGLIEEALKKNIPVLGICLGAQLLAHTLGACVRKHDYKEIGWHKVHLTDDGKSDSLFAHYNASEYIFQLHGDTFDIPKGGGHLAWSDYCEGQAFRYGDKAYGLQFHLEVDQEMIHRWLQIPEVQRDFLNSQETAVTGQAIIEDTSRYMERSLVLSEATFGRFADIFNLPNKRIVLMADPKNLR